MLGQVSFMREAYHATWPWGRLRSVAAVVLHGSNSRNGHVKRELTKVL
jgi:hypothetical protein